MSLRALILIIINSLVFLVVVILSITFYNQFSHVIDDRVLKQLNSIKTLKKVQVENLIKTEWHLFLNDPDTIPFNDDFKIAFSKTQFPASGIYDITPYHKKGETSIAMVLVHGNQIKLKVIPFYKIKDILLERTGMGNTGESYLVGIDYYMRSQSRFFPKAKPFTILVKTEGAQNALAGKKGRGVYKDYRSIDVYGVYSPIKLSHLNLVILSEIDKSEVTAPLQDLKLRLLGLMFLIIFIAIVLSLILTRIVVNPVINMKNSLKIMADGHYYQSNKFVKNSNEIKEMFEALHSLKKSLQGAVEFSNEIGKMNLNSVYESKSQNDLLGKSLIKMRDKLIEFRNNENKHRINTKRQLVDGLENERRRLSRELHDGIGPLLTALKFYIENNIESKTQQLEMKAIVDNTISEVRLMSNALMPSTIDDFGVGPALINFVESINKASNITINFEDLTKQADSKLTKTQKINLFRIVQELINNALKHSNAETIRITLSEFDDFISLFYFDNGKGFNIDTVILGSGIINIKERVEICNGDIQIQSEPGHTTFEIELPIEYDEHY